MKVVVLTLTRLFELADGIAKALKYTRYFLLSRNPKEKRQNVDVRTLFKPWMPLLVTAKKKTST